jgi:V8-like Glu-specific endopeptidase
MSKHRMTNSPFSFALGVLALASGTASAQSATFAQEVIRYPYDTGAIINAGSESRTVISFPVKVEGAGWLRLGFNHVVLAGEHFAGSGATLRITSIRDGDVQELSEVNVRQWRETTAYFNGDTVLVEVVAAPGTGASRLVLETVWAGFPRGGQPETQCGPTDDRTPSNDARVARILPGVCTGFLIDDCMGCFLTAGHCTGSSQLQCVQFNVPATSSGCVLGQPSASDQYAVDPSSVQRNNGVTGDDYATFGVFPNSNTGKTPAAAQGQTFFLSAEPPYNANEKLRVTGHGDDTEVTKKFTQQTHAGPWIPSSGTTVKYEVDTEGGNSGSPVIHVPSGLAIGIHETGDCQTTQNKGTLITHPGLQAFLASPKGVCAPHLRALAPMPTQLMPHVPTTVLIAAPLSAQLGSVFLHHRYGPGPFQTSPMLPLGSSFWYSTLNPVHCATTPEWYFSAASVECGVMTLPANAPASGIFSATVPAAAFPYCVAKPGLTCGDPTVLISGASSATATSGFVLRAGPARQNKTGILLYTDSGPNNGPFNGGTLCVNTPFRRGPAISSGGVTPCGGEFVLDMNAFASGLAGGNPDPFLRVAGTRVHTQWWGRDSIATGSFLSQGAWYTVCP